MTRPAIHPGEILADELEEIGITPTELSRQLGVPPNRISQIIAGKRAITGDTALRLGHWFRNSAQFWLNLQSSYDLRVAEAAVGPEGRGFAHAPGDWTRDADAMLKRE
jgi:addiction module HigA family antidote